MAFTPRLTRPTAGNKYYIRKASGGYSNAIQGKPTDSQCDVLHNCFSGDTRIITRDGVRRLDEIEDVEVMALSRDGVYRNAVGRYFGTQKVYSIEFMNGDKFTVTGNHRWLVRRASHWNGRTYEKYMFKTTLELNSHDYIPYVKNEDIDMDREGIIHGFIYGDGNYYNSYRYSQANLCGFKKEYMFEYFDDAKHIIEQTNGTISCYPYPKEYKLIPDVSSESLSYLRGFIAGLIASDGCVDRYGCISIGTVKSRDAELISDILSVLGYRNHITTEVRDTNYKKNSTLYSIHIKKSFLPFQIFLNPKHQERFLAGNPRNDSFTRVVDIIDLEREEDVYCIQEPETHTMTLEGGILTGQCVGYAYGRFNEIGGYGYCKYLAPVNAENFIEHKGSCKVGQTPQVGACMVWRKGATLNGSDGAGHVAIVEKVVSDTEVVTSESGWNSSKPFWTQTRKKGSDGRWGCGSAYTFLGFIYNPAVDPNNVVTESKPASTTTTTTTTNKNTTSTPNKTTDDAMMKFVKDIQKAIGVTVDGIAGPITLSKTPTVSAKKNRTHAVVKIIQKRLKELGYAEVGTADGVAGPKFTSAVAHLQQDNGCVVDGEITAKNKTWKVLLGMM